MTGLDNADMMEIYFVFFFPPQKKERNPTHIAANLQTPTSQRYNQSQKLSGCQRAAILLTHPCKFVTFEL